jgi:hypothetical protein
MPSVPLLEVGQSVLVAPTPDDAPWRMNIDLVQDGHITLATVDDERLPSEWKALEAVHVTALDRFNVHLIHVRVVRAGDTRLVIETPDASTPMTRRAYARVFSPVPATFMVLDVASNEWSHFEAEMRDLGGGGCSVVADRVVADGAPVVITFAIDGQGPLVVVGKVLPRESIPTIGKILTRIEFALIREADRDRVLRYVLLTLAGRRHALTETTLR